MARPLGPRQGTADPLCEAIREGWIKHRQRHLGAWGNPRLWAEFRDTQALMADGGDVVMTSHIVWRALLMAGQEREATEWHRTVDCEADDRLWMIPATGPMFECDAEGVPL